MQDREERGRRSPGALRPLKDTTEGTMHCHNCLRILDRAQNTPKLLSGKRVLCLNCTTTQVNEDQEMLCRDCWNRTQPTNPVPGPSRALCRVSSGDLSSSIESPQSNALATFGDATITATTHQLCADLNYFVMRQRNFLMRALDATATLQMRLEAKLSSLSTISSISPEGPPYSFTAIALMEHLDLRRTSALLHCRLDDLVASAGVLLDFELMQRALLGLHQPEALCGAADQSELDPELFLANFCAAQVYTRTCHQLPDGSAPGAPPMLRLPSSYPLFYFNLEVDGLPFGRFVIEVRNDLAPRMARNFSVLTTGELGIGYRGCTIFQCWEHESVITGDFEMNTGQGGRSVFEKGFFVPDDTKLTAVRGSVGMRRSQKRRNHWGLVGSQFRIILREMRDFTAIFGSVVEGLELVEQLSCTGNSAGRPKSTILIASCGKLN